MNLSRQSINLASISLKLVSNSTLNCGSGLIPTGGVSSIHNEYCAQFTLLFYSARAPDPRVVLPTLVRLVSLDLSR